MLRIVLILPSTALAFTNYITNMRKPTIKTLYNNLVSIFAPGVNFKMLLSKLDPVPALFGISMMGFIDQDIRTFRKPRTA